MNSKPFYILSIDGGGIRGILPAHILECIQTHLGVNLLEQFDMVAGTSTGSIIVAAVVCDISLDKVTHLYKQQGATIFKKRKFWWDRLSAPALQSRYQNNFLYSVLNELFGDVTLGEISTPLILPATDIGNGKIHVFKSEYSDEASRDKSVLLKDAILASCSAPTYFDPTNVDEYLLADGGLWANNPALAAVIDAQQQLNIELEDIRVLSIGTGSSLNCYGVKKGRKWGFINGWKGSEFISFWMSLQTRTTHNYLQLLLEKTQFIRLDFESDGPLYWDDCSGIDDLISKADEIFTQNTQQLQDFLGAN